MSARAIPAFMSITQFADLLGLPRKMVAYRVDAGTIPSMKMGAGRNARRWVSIARLKQSFPELWDAVLMKADVLSEYDLEEPDDFV